jgi:hypothetical protein
MIESGITNPLRLDPRLTNRRYHFTKHLILAPRGNKSGGSILAAKVAQFLTAVEIDLSSAGPILATGQLSRPDIFSPDKSSQAIISGIPA